MDEEIVGGEPAGNPLELLLANRDANISVSEKEKFSRTVPRLPLPHRVTQGRTELRIVRLLFLSL